MLKIGGKVKIKEESWRKFCVDNGYPENSPNISEQTIIKIQPNYGGRRLAYYLITFPFVWWEENDLEVVPEIVYEQVDAIQCNDKMIRRGDTLRCSCRYTVFTLYPVWDSKTGKHLKEHSNNSFSCNRIEACMCPVHGKKKEERRNKS